MFASWEDFPTLQYPEDFLSAVVEGMALDNEHFDKKREDGVELTRSAINNIRVSIATVFSDYRKSMRLQNLTSSMFGEKIANVARAQITLGHDLKKFIITYLVVADKKKLEICVDLDWYDKIPKLQLQLLQNTGLISVCRLYDRQTADEK